MRLIARRPSYLPKLKVAAIWLQAHKNDKRITGTICQQKRRYALLCP